MRIKQIFSLCLWIILSCLILFMTPDAAEGAAIGLYVCKTSIIPSLFPFFALTDYWISSNYTGLLSSFTEPLTVRLFHLPGAASSALILGSIGGYPVGIKTIVKLYSNNNLTREQAEQASLFCNNAGPAFVLGILGARIFQSVKLGIWLYIIHLAGSYLIGFIFRPQKLPCIHPPNESIDPDKSHLQLWTDAITSAGKTTLLVSTYVIFFSILTKFLLTMLPTTPIMSILISTAELAGGSNLIATTAMSLQMKFIVCASLLGFGGICVMMQSISLIQAAGLSARKLILGKIYHGFCSGVLAAALTPFLNFAHPCALVAGPVRPHLLETVLLLILIFGMFKFLKESSGKVSKNRL